MLVAGVYPPMTHCHRLPTVSCEGVARTTTLKAPQVITVVIPRPQPVRGHLVINLRVFMGFTPSLNIITILTIARLLSLMTPRAM